MNEETSTPEPTNEPRKMPLNARLAVVVAIVLFLFMLQYTANGCARETINMSWLGRSTSAIAAAIAPSIIEGNPIRTRQLIEEIAREARYAGISVSDVSGKVIASTDRMLEGTVVRSMANAPELPVLTRENGRLVAVRRVATGPGNVLGAVKVEVGPD